MDNATLPNESKAFNTWLTPGNGIKPRVDENYTIIKETRQLPQSEG